MRFSVFKMHATDAKRQKIEPDTNFFGRKKVSEAVSKRDRHNVRSCLFLTCKNFGLGVQFTFYRGVRNMTVWNHGIIKKEGYTDFYNKSKMVTSSLITAHSPINPSLDLYSSLTWIRTLLLSSTAARPPRHIYLHLLKSEFVSTCLTHFPVEIFLFVQQLLRPVNMLMNAGVFLKHTAPDGPPQLWKPDEDGEDCDQM